MADDAPLLERNSASKNNAAVEVRSLKPSEWGYEVDDTGYAASGTDGEEWYGIESHTSQNVRRRRLPAHQVRGVGNKRRSSSRRLYAAQIAESLDIGKSEEELSRSGWKTRVLSYGVVYCRRNSPAPASTGSGEDDRAANLLPIDSISHAFIFEMGCIVTWGCELSIEMGLISKLSVHSQRKYGKMYDDDMKYIIGTAVKIRNDEVVTTAKIIEMLAISWAFAQSVKVSMYEENIEELVEISRSVPKSLAATGKIPLTQKEVAKLTGRVFEERYAIFLDSQLLDDTPDFFWESDKYHPVYLKGRRYLDVDKRLQLISRRLEIVRELLDMMANQLENNHANRLEVIIVILILAEVALQVIFGFIDAKCVQLCHLGE